MVYKEVKMVSKLLKVFTRNKFKDLVMASHATRPGYEGNTVQNFKTYLEQSGEHKAMFSCLQDILQQEFRPEPDMSSFDVLGVGSGGGEMDIQMLTLLQASLGDVQITTDIVEGSVELLNDFKASVAQTPTMQKIPFNWHLSSSEEYIGQVKATEVVKKFDFIHMIQMIYYVDDLTAAINFYHSLLKSNGRLIIILDSEKAGPDILWTAFHDEICTNNLGAEFNSAHITECLSNLGLRYKRHVIPNTINVTECFNPGSQIGENLLSLLTERESFSESFSPETRVQMLDVLRNKCSTEECGKVLFNCELSCFVVFP